MSRMFERLDRGEPVVGALALTSGAELVETACEAGLDYICIDMMRTSIDWSQAASMIRATKVYNATSWLRLQGFSWGHDDYRVDSRLAADTLRAFSIGAECVVASVSRPDEVAAMLLPLTESVEPKHVYRKGAATQRGASDRPLSYDVDARRFVIPLIESTTALNNLPDILELEGVKAIFLGLADLTRGLGHPGEDRHPEVRKVVKDVIDQAAARGVAVCCNVIRSEESDDPARVAEGAQWLWNNGARILWIPYPPFILQRFYQRTLALFEKGLNG